MELKNYLVELLSNIIHDKLELLSNTNKNMNSIDDYKRIEELFSDTANILKIDNDDLRNVLSKITDSDTVEEIISNIDMIKIVVNGQNNGLDLSLDDSQEALIKGVYEIVNNFRTKIENENIETRKYLEDFIDKCESLSNEIGTGVVRDVETLDSILVDSDVNIDDIIKCKYEILRNNNKNYNLNLEGKVKEEVELRIAFKKLNIDLDSYSEIERRILINYGDISNIKALIDFISSNKLEFSSRNLFIVLLLSNVSNLTKICEITDKYEININRLFMMPGVFISSKDPIETIIAENKTENDYYIIEYLENIGAYFDNFINNISIVSNNRNVKECFESNMLAFIIPDMNKNNTILEELTLTDKEFSIIVINPFLATSISGFTESGLSEYIKSNPLRLTTSYYRLREINLRIVNARRNGNIIFRSLSDKKNYWLAKNITVGENKDTEVR